MANELIYSPVTSDDYFYQFQTEGGSEGTYFFTVGYYKLSNATLRGAIRFTSINLAQGTSIYAANVHMYVGIRSGSSEVKAKIWGINEDNTADFSSGGGVFARSRTTNSNTNSYSATGTGGYFTIGVTSMVQQIINRGGWSSGNAIGFVVEDNGTSTSETSHIEDSMYEQPNCVLEILLSATPNFKPTPTTVNADPFPAPSNYGISIAKPGQNVLTASEDQLYYTSRKKQLKVFMEGQASTSGGTVTVTHNLGYVPVVIAYYYNDSTGAWEKFYFYGSIEASNLMEIDTTKVVFTTDYSKVYYYIFLDQLST